VYQTTSNFGDQGNPHLEDLLGDLKKKGLIDSLVRWPNTLIYLRIKVFYDPKVFSEDEREDLITDTNPAELGGPKIGVANQFLNEGTLPLCISKTQLRRENLEGWIASSTIVRTFFA
jgi:hypothetical protein